MAYEEIPSEWDVSEVEPAPPGPPPSPGTSPYDPARDRERMRGRIAVGILGLYAVVLLILLGALLGGNLTLDELQEAAAALLGPLVGVVGAVMGFYYGGGRGST